MAAASGVCNIERLDVSSELRTLAEVPATCGRWHSLPPPSLDVSSIPAAGHNLVRCVPPSLRLRRRRPQALTPTTRLLSLHLLRCRPQALIPASCLLSASPQPLVTSSCRGSLLQPSPSPRHPPDRPPNPPSIVWFRSPLPSIPSVSFRTCGSSTASDASPDRRAAATFAAAFQGGGRNASSTSATERPAEVAAEALEDANRDRVRVHLHAAFSGAHVTAKRSKNRTPLPFNRSCRILCAATRLLEARRTSRDGGAPSPRRTCQSSISSPNGSGPKSATMIGSASQAARWAHLPPGWAPRATITSSRSGSTTPPVTANRGARARAFAPGLPSSRRRAASC